MRGTNLTENEFSSQQRKLTGMNESSTTSPLSQQVISDDSLLAKRILENASLQRAPSPTVTEGKMTRYVQALFSTDFNNREVKKMQI